VDENPVKEYYGIEFLMNLRKFKWIYLHSDRWIRVEETEHPGVLDLCFNSMVASHISQVVVKVTAQ
jgi:hypothetical protein